MKGLRKIFPAEDAATVLPVDAVDRAGCRRDPRTHDLPAENRSEELRVLVLASEDAEGQGFVRLLSSLTEFSVTVTTTGSFNEAQHLLARQGFDVAFIEDRHGALSGVRFVRESGGRSSDVPLIVLGSADSPDSGRSALAAGAYDALSFDEASPALLSRVVRHVLRQHHLFQHLKWVERENRELANAAGSASEVKMNFLARMSHDLRTPLNAILGFSDIIRCRAFGDDLDRYTEYAAIIHESGGSLCATVDNLLDLSLARAGELQMNFGNVDLVEVVRETLGEFEELASAKRLTIRIDADKGAASVVADRYRVHQMVANLLSNAVKYTPDDGALTIGVRRHLERVELFVSDTGKGIPREVLERVMQPFHQTGDPMVDDGSSMTIGLALVNCLVEQHGGSLAVHSREGIGTTVCLRFPLADPAA